MIVRLATIAIWTVAGFTFEARGELAFDRRTVEVPSAEGGRILQAEFSFVNRGEKAVKILSLLPSCGCTTASAGKDVYQPGEKGVIRVAFEVGQQTGAQRKSVIVVTDDGSEPVQLALTASIEPTFKAGRRVAFWRKGAAPAPFEIEIEIARAKPLFLRKVATSSEGFEVKLSDVKSGRRYRLSVTPRSTQAAARATITVQPEAGQEKESEFTVVALIR